MKRMREQYRRLRDKVLGRKRLYGRWGTDEEFVTGSGQVLVNTHQESPDCHEFGCPIHAPSAEAEAIGFTHWRWRGDRQLMERICPHGVGHPDPDHLRWVARTLGEESADIESIHGCDGCCR